MVRSSSTLPIEESSWAVKEVKLRPLRVAHDFLFAVLVPTGSSLEEGPMGSFFSVSAMVTKALLDGRSWVDKTELRRGERRREGGL